MTTFPSYTRYFVAIMVFGASTVALVAQEPKTGSPAPVAASVASSTPPSWTRDAKWYYAVVSRFRNGDPSNDPAGTAAWNAARPTNKSAMDSYGGDLQGLRSKLPYLKALGVNVLCLSSVFQARPEAKFLVSDWRHVDDSFGVKDSLKKISGETDDPKSWKLSESDKFFLGFIEEAHKHGIRVVLHVMFAPYDREIDAKGVDPELSRGAVASLNPKLERHLLPIAKRWMDPNGDGKPTDGIDGWMHGGGKKPVAFWKRWQGHVKSINSNALTVAYVAGGSGQWPNHPFDAEVHQDSVQFVADFLSIRPSKPSPIDKRMKNGRTGYVGALKKIIAQQDQEPSASLNVLGDQFLGRGRSLPVSIPTDDRPKHDPTKLLAAQRLATVIQHFLPGAPMTYYGEEVGMYGPHGAARAPMWWNDLPGGQTKAADYREDLTSLTQWLHLRRDIDEPLRRGKLRKILVDDANKTLVLARTMPNKEIVLVMNYGDKKQKVMVPMGQPGEMVALCTPHLTRGPRARPMPAGEAGIRPLPMGGNKQLINHEGEVRVWVKPMSVRFVLRQQ